MSTALYTYSGTGNSLHVARELQKRLPDSHLLPMVRLLREERVVTTADTIGLVFPNFCMTVPIPVHDFLSRVDLASADYLFAVSTRGGTTSVAFRIINEALGKQDLRLDAQLDITMPWNHPMGEDLPATATPERIAQLEAEMQVKLDRFCERVRAREPFVVDDTDADFVVPGWAKAMDALVPRSLNYKLHRYMYQNRVHFYADSTCNSCGICEKVCLSEKILLVDERPARRPEAKCYACFACINFCPRQAIQIRSRFPVKSRTPETARYHHPSVTYMDIAWQR